ncbi:hypothetical protein RRG08_020950 [Elysia crispata]|uniref:G-protein coupled receptors family 1 profile domain-containing protein n=1 Tax=Elysia crispata TaxID=231223 RepID=A0AAE1D7U4_9GAST|nr:hypothetical protein RRG08_020950 [Elysia crispata]
MAVVVIYPNWTIPSTSSDIAKDFTFDLSKLPFRALYYDATAIYLAFYIPILLFGITANILNIVVFNKTGARDNVTVSFMALSVTDLLYLVGISPFCTVLTIVFYVEEKLGIKLNWLIDKEALAHPSYWYSFVFYETSILITVYISVVRCACVAIPFTVKNIFTSRRAIVTFITFFISVLLLRVPVFMTKRVMREFDPISNTTKVVYKELDDGGLSEKLHDIMNRNILNWSSIVIVIACLVVMVTKLRTSARFRSSAGATHPAETQTGPSDVDLNNAQATSSEQDPGKQISESKSSTQTGQTKTFKGKKLPSSEKKKQQMLSNREAQVVRVVILVAAVFVTCQTPLMAYTLVRRFESQFDNVEADGEFMQFSKYLYLFSLITNIASLFTLINASVNIVIHYNFNSRYRETMKTLWKCH